jgi:gas vesicle protein
MDESTKDQARREAEQTAGVAKEKAGEVASAATGQTKQVAETAKEQAGQVREQVTHQGREVIQRATSAIKDQGRAQTEQLASKVRSWADQARALADGRPAEADAFADYVGQAANRATGVAERLEQRGFDGVLDDVQSFARRRPGVFLLGAALAGFGVGRLLRSGAASGSGSPPSTGNGQAASPALPQPATELTTPVSPLRPETGSR